MTHPRGAPIPFLPRPVQVPLLLATALFLMATGRWGAYVGVPGLPIYVGDVLVAAATVQTVRALRRTGSGVHHVRQALADAPMGLLLCLALLAWAVVRFVTGFDAVLEDPLVALRDVVPYVYAIVALLTFLLPAAARTGHRRLIYGALTAHATWVVAAGYLPGWPWPQPLLGGAVIFTARADVDSAVMGMAIALALHEMNLNAASRRGLVLRLAFVAFNAYAVTTLPTRAGFLAGVVAVGAILVLRIARPTMGSGRRPMLLRVGAVLLGVLVLVGAIAITPPGQRLVEGVQGLRGEQTQASGTIAVREFVWGGVTDYATADFSRTAVGVGFGPDFIDASGTAYALEGTEYKDVRSPHNYVIGTFGRLGVAGALLAALVLLANAVLGLRALVRAPGTVDTLAALVLLTTPVTALLGVVLESPFGAIPYFWAVGQVSRTAWSRRHQTQARADRGRVLPVTGSALQTVTLSRYQR